jgi:chemotaxis methyl-accepting protein methylase
MDRAPNERSQEAATLRAILSELRERTGTDFSIYRPAMVERRIRNRMISLGLTDLRMYLARLQSTPSEPQHLLERITIKVSRFYRNQAAFETLYSEVLPALVARNPRRPLRIWSAGCAHGEEPYSLALLLAELGREDVVEATDLDPGALERARAGVYPPEALEELPPHLRERYFEPTRSGRSLVYRVSSLLRTRVRFRQHDLTATNDGETFGPFDLVTCRNVLIYLQRDAQQRVFQDLRNRVAEGGVLCLGEAEWPPPAHERNLSIVDRKNRIFWFAPELANRRAS